MKHPIVTFRLGSFAASVAGLDDPHNKQSPLRTCELVQVIEKRNPRGGTYQSNVYRASVETAASVLRSLRVAAERRRFDHASGRSRECASVTRAAQSLARCIEAADPRKDIDATEVEIDRALSLLRGRRFRHALDLPPCPRCQAVAGEPCRRPSGQTADPHRSRSMKR